MAVAGAQLELFVLHQFPQSFDENVAAPSALAVHADGDAVPLEPAGERLAGELAALVGAEDLRCDVAGDGFLDGLDAERGVPW